MPRTTDLRNGGVQGFFELHESVFTVTLNGGQRAEVLVPAQQVFGAEVTVNCFGHVALTKKQHTIKCSFY